MKNQKVKGYIVLGLIAFIFICIIVILVPSGNDESEPSTQVTETQQPESEAAESTENEEPAAETETESATKKSGLYELDEMSIIYADSVRNDTTGNWRLSKVTGNKSVEEYALDYYKEFFTDDSEVHAIVNFTLNTTARINAGNGLINVAIYEYVDGEEHDAKALFGGEKLAEYSIDVSTGEMTEIK